MRVATFNIEHGAAALGSEHHGEVPDAKSLVRLADDLRALDLDVLCLQEVDQGQRRSGGLNQAEILSRELGMHNHRFAAFFQGWVGGLRFQPLRSDASGRMAFGIATLSRFPVSSWHVNTMGRAVPKVKVRDGGSGWRPSDRLALVDTSRTVLAAQVVAPEGSVSVVNTHLAPDVHEAGRQLAEVLDSLSTLPTPQVLAGDLNLEPADVTAPGLRELAAASTFSNTRPQRQIDHILGSPEVRVEADGAESLSFSDHRLLWADLSFQ
ncbi:MAG: endonuclease/exonuclease/phosphatase family protein [Actinomycetota bacterium]